MVRGHPDAQLQRRWERVAQPERLPPFPRAQARPAVAEAGTSARCSPRHRPGHTTVRATSQALSSGCNRRFDSVFPQNGGGAGVQAVILAGPGSGVYPSTFSARSHLRWPTPPARLEEEPLTPLRFVRGF